MVLHVTSQPWQLRGHGGVVRTPVLLGGGAVEILARPDPGDQLDPAAGGDGPVADHYLLGHDGGALVRVHELELVGEQVGQRFGASVGFQGVSVVPPGFGHTIGEGLPAPAVLAFQHMILDVLAQPR